MTSLTFKPAVTLSLDDLARAFNAAFAGYFYPQSHTGQTFARRVRLEQLDLHHSLIAYEGAELAGLFLLGIRGERGWCGGFGIVQELRGRGLSHELMSEMAEEARRAGLKRLSLEVLARNEAARHLYESAGMRVTRDLLILGLDDERRAARRSSALTEAGPEKLLRHFTRMHSCAPAWQRDLSSLLATDGVRGLCLGEKDEPRAYALIVERPAEGFAHLVDLAACDEESAHALTEGLCALPYRLRVVNEPEESLFIKALKASGFVEQDRQHEMELELSS